MSKSHLKFLGTCPVCAHSYLQKRMSIVQKQQDTVTIHVDCPECESSILLAVNSSKNGLITTVGIPTDLTKKDVKKFVRARPVTSNDVLELHKILKKKT